MRGHRLWPILAAAVPSMPYPKTNLALLAGLPCGRAFAIGIATILLGAVCVGYAETAPLAVTLSAAEGFGLAAMSAACGYALARFTLRREVRELRTEFAIDEMTGLKNSRALHADLKTLRRTPSFSEAPTALILLDIDNFRAINHRHGYMGADVILSEIGAILKRDTRITDEAYRYFERGDEFLILARATSVDNAYRAAERKRRHIAETAFIVAGERVRVTVSCGLSVREPGECIEDALARANTALRNAKDAEGKNSTVIAGASVVGGAREAQVPSSGAPAQLTALLTGPAPRTTPPGPVGSFPVASP